MDFYGLPVETLGNEFFHLDYLRGAGPRIVRLFFGNSEDNLLAEMPGFTVPTPYGDYNFLGGHRLWHSPEALPRTYVPDASGLQIQPLENGVRLIAPVEAPTGIQKSMELRLLPGRAGVTIHHRLENQGLWPVELAPWAITQLKHGGVAVIPQQIETDPRNLLLPDRVLALWSYAALNDPRLHLHDDFIMMDGVAAQPPCKIGAANKRGWIGYYRNGVFFNKRFTLRPGLPHPDFGVNTEIYVDHRFIECETLGPLVRLEVGQSVLHTETWELWGGLDYPQTIDGVRALAKDLRLNEAEMILQQG